LDVTIETYRPEFREAYEQLNRDWLESNGLLEDADLDYLANPERRILSPGGQMYFAVDQGRVVGTCSAIPVSPSVVELAKLAVDRSARGRGIGRTLAEAVIEFARQRSAETVVLTSSSVLVPAIRLYEALGFRHAPMPPEEVRYKTADVYMMLNLVERETD
jgi:ribosomal protein S18 acetylase RimI-like enzyme